MKKILSILLLLGIAGCSHFLNYMPGENLKKHFKEMSHKKAIRLIDTPEKAKRYLTEYLYYQADSISYGKIDYLASFKTTHSKGAGDCDDGAIAAAALLSDDGYAPLFLKMYIHSPRSTSIGLTHGIYTYQENGLWGSLGISEKDCAPAQFKTIDELVRHHQYFKFAVMNLDSLYPDWINEDLGKGGKIYEKEMKYVD